MQVQGIILDEFGTGIADVNVLVLNPNGTKTTVGTHTDFDGKFSINNAAISSVTTPLQISAVGFKTIVVPVASLVATKNVITLETDAKMLDGFIGYGKKKGFNWWWLLLIPVGYGVYKYATPTAKKVKL